MFTKLKRWFTSGEWKVAIKEKTSVNYRIIDVPKGKWIADPFVINDDGHHFLFVELYDSNKGKAGIGVFNIHSIDDIEYNGSIIENTYHMSYPCVFRYESNYFLIPETSANSTLELYRAVSFPDKWELDAVLLTGTKVVDSTVFCDGKDFYLMSYEKVSSGWDLILFLLDMKSKTIQEISRTHYKKNVARPAGMIFGEQQLKRPAQDCSKYYGKRILMYDVINISKQGLSEECNESIEIDDIKIDQKAQRIHTYNSDDTYEVVDVFVEKLDLLHTFKILKRMLTK